MAPAGKFVLTRKLRVHPKNPTPTVMTGRTVSMGILEYDDGNGNKKTWYTLEGHDDGLSITTTRSKYSRVMDDGKKPSFYVDKGVNGYDISGIVSCVCAGTFPVTLQYSSAFTMKKSTVKGYYDCYCEHNNAGGILMPHLQRENDAGGSGRSGVLIHCGKSFQDTLGCILVGNKQDTVNGKLDETELAFQEIYDIFSKKVNGKYPTFQLEIKRSYSN